MKYPLPPSPANPLFRQYEQFVTFSLNSVLSLSAFPLNPRGSSRPSTNIDVIHEYSLWPRSQFLARVFKSLQNSSTIPPRCQFYPDLSLKSKQDILFDRVCTQLWRDPRIFFSTSMFRLYLSPHSIAEVQAVSGVPSHFWYHEVLAQRYNTHQMADVQNTLLFPTTFPTPCAWWNRWPDVTVIVLYRD